MAAEAQVFVILEGIDGAGKTTLAKAIKDLEPSFIYKPLGPPASPGTALDECISDGEYGHYVPGDGVNLLSDRLHWGCPVYGPVYRPDADRDGYGDFGRSGWRYAELYTASRGAATFFAEVEPTEARRRIEIRGDDYVDLDDLSNLAARYSELAAESLTIAGRVTVELDTVGELALDIVEKARSREKVYAPLARWRHYVGPRDPRTLFIMPPLRELRLEVLDTMSDDDWSVIGMCSANTTELELHGLHTALGEPNVVGVGKIPGSTEHFIDANGGYFVGAPTDLKI